MAEEAWRRWGDDDELGALNLIGPAEVMAALALPRQGRILSLAQPISEAMMAPGHRPRPAHFMGRDGGDYAAGGRRPFGFQFAEDTLFLPLHVGTHIDCLCHVWYGDQLYNGASGNTVRSTGAARSGAETLGPIVTRGVLLDCVAVKGAPFDDGETIGADILAKAIARAGVTLRAGDAVLIRTGWLERNTGNRAPDFFREPGIDLEAGLMLARADVALVGADNYAIEVLPFPEGTLFPVHMRLMRDYGIPLLEGLVLDTIAAAGATEFLFMASALPIVGGTASPIAPLAVL